MTFSRTVFVDALPLRPVTLPKQLLQLVLHALQQPVLFFDHPKQLQHDLSQKASFFRQVVGIDLHLPGLFPLHLFQFQCQIHPLLAQFPEAFVVGEFLPHLRQPLGPHETSAALAAPGKAEVVVGPVLLGILGIFAAAAGLAANVVLLAQAPGMHRSQSSQLLFHLLDPVFDLCCRHGRYHHSDIGYCQAFSPWIAVYEILEEAGLEVYLVNARETKNLRGGRRTCRRASG
jgi:hypothetical protein